MVNGGGRRPARLGMKIVGSCRVGGRGTSGVSGAAALPGEHGRRPSPPLPGRGGWSRFRGLSADPVTGTYAVDRSPLTHTDTFVRRHIGPDAGEVAEMLSALGYDSLDDLIDATVPASIRL